MYLSFCLLWIKFVPLHMVEYFMELLDFFSRLLHLQTGNILAMRITEKGERKLPEFFPGTMLLVIYLSLPCHFIPWMLYSYSYIIMWMHAEIANAILSQIASFIWLIPWLQCFLSWNSWNTTLCIHINVFISISVYKIVRSRNIVSKWSAICRISRKNLSQESRIHRNIVQCRKCWGILFWTELKLLPHSRWMKQCLQQFGEKELDSVFNWWNSRSFMSFWCTILLSINFRTMSEMRLWVTQNELLNCSKPITRDTKQLFVKNLIQSQKRHFESNAGDFGCSEFVSCIPFTHFLLFCPCALCAK